MAEHAKHLMEQRAEIIAQIKRLDSQVASEKRNYTNEEKEQYDKLDAQQDELKERADTLARSERANEIAPVIETRATNFSRSFNKEVSDSEANTSLKAWALSSVPGADVPSEFLNVAQRNNVVMGSNFMKMENPLNSFQRANNKLSDAAGAYTVDGNVVKGIVNRLVSMGGILNEISYENTDDGRPMSFASNDDSANTASIVAEGSAPSDPTSPTYGTISWGSFQYRTGALEVSNQLLRDSSFDLLGHIQDRLAERIWRKVASDVSVGAGTTLPFGIVTKSTEGYVSTDASYAAADFDEIIDLEASLDELYHPSAVYMMKRATATKYRKVKKIVSGEFDSNDPIYGNEYLWQPSLIAGQPDTMNGKRIVYNPFMAVHGTAAKRVVLFGNLKKYIWRNVGQMRLVLDPWTAINKNCVNFQVFFEGDGNLSDVNSCVHLTTKKT